MSSGNKRGYQPDFGDDAGLAKRSRAPDAPPPDHQLSLDDYTVGWVCALDFEMAAAEGMLEKVHLRPGQQDPNDHNCYIFGEAWGHNVVIACLPDGIYGTTTAATVAKDMLRTFKSLRFGLMVGVGGGIPSKSHDIRLGDIVVSRPWATNGGIVQYDLGKALQEDGFQRAGSLNTSPQVLLTALNQLRAKHLIAESRVPEFLEGFLSKLPRKKRPAFTCPGTSNDRLFLADYPHSDPDIACEQCDLTQTVSREARDDTEPVIHYGTIASGNLVIKDSKKRDQIGKDLGALCVEMEAAGLHDFPCIVIRGICDYADSHKNKIWQFYAATAAAAFAKEFLSVLPPSRVLQHDPIPQLVSIASKSLNVSKQHLDVSLETLGESRRINKILEDRPIDLCVVHEACYDSEDVGGSPRCEANTRVRIQESIKQWANDEEGESFFWLVGPAGTGKSTLIRSVADSFHQDARLVAGYFFKRGEQGRNDTNRLFSTLAIQMADAIPCFKDCLRASIGNTDKDSIDKKGLEFQFMKLIKTPFQSLPPSRTNKSPRIIVLDALDECERPENLPRVLAFISEICNKSTTLNFRVLLASRPDLRIISAIEPLIQDGIARKLQLHRVFSEDTKDDIRLYLKMNLMRIKRKANIRQDPWPSVAEVTHLVELSTHPEPLFIYAATLLRFVYDENHLQNPKNQLKIWIKQCENNESQLHQMYNPILEQIFALGKDTDFDQQLQFLGVLVLTALPLSLASLTSLLDLDIDDVNWWLPTLHAVLDIPSDSHKPLRLLHKSFSDFLLSEENPGHDRFRLDAREVHALLADRCIQLMGRRLKRDICDLRKLDVTPQDIDKNLLDRCIPLELQYSCRYWVYHLRASGRIARNQILAFLHQHFLHWLEVSALLRQTSDALEALRDLSDLVKVFPHDPHTLTMFSPLQNSFESSSELVDFLKDATRTISSFAWIIENAPLQTYASLILFSPVASRIRQQFWDQRLPPHSHIEGVKSKWDARVQTFDVGKHVHSLAFSPDGKLLASADTKVRVFNASTGNHLMTFGADIDPQNVIFSYNSQLLAATYPGRDGTVRVWERTTWREVQTIKTSAIVFAVAFSPDDEVLALILNHDDTQSNKASVEFWSVRSRVRQKAIDFHRQLGSDFWRMTAISPSLEQFAFCSANGTVVLWSLVTGTVQHTFPVDGSEVFALAFSPNGGLLVAKCSKAISIWDTTTYSLKFTKKNFEYSNKLCFCPHNQLLASTASSTGIIIWDLATGLSFDLGLTNKTAFTFSSDGQLLATSSLRDGLTVWDVACLYPEHNQPLLDANTVDNMTLAFSPNGKFFVSRAEQGTIQIRDSQTGKPVRDLTEGSYPKFFQFSPDSKRLACYYWSSEHWIWDLVGGTKELMSDNSKSKKMSCPVAYSANSQLASVCWNDNILDLYDTTSGNYLSSLQGHVGMIYSIAFSPRDNLLASSSEYGTIQLWDTITRTCQYVIQHIRGIFQGTLKFSPDGKILAYHNWELIHWWDVVTGSHQHMLKARLETGHGKFQEHSFSRNSLLLAVSVLMRRQIDEEVRLYDVKSAKHQSTLIGHSRRALEIIFSPDSSKVAVASSDRRVRLWDATTCTLLYIFDIYTDVPKMTRFSGDGSIIAVASRDKAIRLWHVMTGEFLQMIYHEEGFIQELEVLANEIIVSATDKEPDKLWDPWRTQTFKLSNQSYPLSAASHGYIPERFYSEVSLDLDECWVMRGYEKVIYIPVEYRPVIHKARHRIGKWIGRGLVLCILCSTSKVIYLRLS